MQLKEVYGTSWLHYNMFNIKCRLFFYNLEARENSLKVYFRELVY